MEKKMMKEGKAYPILKALLDALMEAAPGVVKAPAVFLSSLAEQLKDKQEEEVKLLEQEIKSITQDELEVMLKEAGCDQKENIEFIVEAVRIIPQFSQRFDRVDVSLEEIKNLLKLRSEKPLQFPLLPLEPRLLHITALNPNWVGRKDELAKLNQCYLDDETKVVSLIGWGGFGKTALARKWYESLKENNITPDGIFGWSFYKDKAVDAFLEASLNYLSPGNPEIRELRHAPARFAKLTEYLNKGKFLFILDGLEEIQEDNQSDKFGKMKDAAMQGFLQTWAGGGIRESFCLITTRFPMTDLKDCENKGYITIKTEELKVEDGIGLLKKRGVKGEDDELGRLVQEYGGHALSLTLVAGFLNDFCHGEVKRAKEIPFYEMEEEENKALRILKAYDKNLTREQRIFLQVFSCFLRPIDDNAINQVFRKKIKVRWWVVFNKSLVSMDEFKFKQMIHHLEERGLIDKGTTHPLIKNYFEKSLTEEARIAINRRLYRYLGGLAPEQAQNLDQMQPLFEQVYHGCQAGMYQEAHWDVYWQKVQRRDERFIVNKLGAWETNLGIIQNFFPDGDFQKEPLVTKISSKSYLINEAGLSMMVLGRLKEAEGLYKKGIELLISQKDWKNASTGCRNLTGLQILTGTLLEARESSEEAIRLSREAGNVRYECWSTAWLSYTLFLLGKMDTAGIEFEKAEKLQREDDPSKRYLYSNRGIQYADFLLARGKIQEALEVTNENLRICERNHWIDDITLCHRSLASIYRHLKDFKSAEAQAELALEGARKTGRQDIEAESLIELARIKSEQSPSASHQPSTFSLQPSAFSLQLSAYPPYSAAESLINHALQICRRCGYRLYEADCYSLLSQLYLKTGRSNEADEAQTKVRAIAQETGYIGHKDEI